jgi:putative YphP/YqiW family bacilliredoxin
MKVFNMYDESFVKPMREELTSLGAIEMRTPKEVDEVIGSSKGTLLVVVNSVCGCAAGAARPAVKRALQHTKKPDKVATVFAGQDADAANHARTYFTGFKASSPHCALETANWFLWWSADIEGFSAEQIAHKLIQASRLFVKVTCRSN